MKGTIINVIAVIIGSLIGIFFNSRIPEKVQKIAMQAIGLSTILIGVQLGLKTQNILIVIFSLVIGGIIGEIICLEKKLDGLGNFLKKRVKSKDSRFVQGFVTTSLIFCIGALAVVGSFEDGINNNQDLLYTKSLLDGITAIAFSSAMGLGVLFSALTVLVYQGFLTLLAVYLKGFLTDAAIIEMSATGGLLIIGIGLNILEIKNIKVSNLLPSIVVALIIALII